MASLLNMSGGSLLKKGLPYDYEVEYLENNSINNYIDTGIYLNTNSVIYCDYSYDSNRNYAVYGAGNGSTYDKGEISWFYNSGNAQQVVYPISNSGSSHETLYAERNQRHSSIYDKTSIVLDGNIRTRQRYKNYVCGRTLYLFAVNRGINSWFGGEHTKIYKFAIEENDVLLIDLIPVVKDNVGYMYDKVSGRLFGNAGTGSFIVGPRV